MDPNDLFGLTAMLFVGGVGGVAYAFLGGSDGHAETRRRRSARERLRNQRRIGRRRQPAPPQERSGAAEGHRKTIRPTKAARTTMRRRLEQAGLDINAPHAMATSGARSGRSSCAAAACSPGSFWRRSGAAFAAVSACRAGYWAFMRNRRLKKFTAEFANAIDVIVRSVKSGLPTNEALKIVAKEAPRPWDRNSPRSAKARRSA